ncbi:MAG: DUF2238 domain-containing protein [Planctomycetota bacterium]
MSPESNDHATRSNYFDAEFRVLVSLLAAVAITSFVFTEDRVNWLLDAGWVAVGLPLISVSRRWFPLTPLLYRLLVFHALVLIAGGYWTYEKMPLGVWLQELLGTERNHFDRFGHFMQGFVPAIIFREVFLRCSPIPSGGWLIYFVLSSCLAFSALFELIEWWATLLNGGNADAFLGHQGDIWDAQWDMLWAVAGALAALTFLSWAHDRSLNRLLGSLE